MDNQSKQPASPVYSTETSPATAQAVEKLPARTPRSVIVTLLLVFPPAAWLFMAMDKTYHHWLVKVLYVSGLITLCFLAFFYFTVGVQLTELYTALGIEDSVNLDFTIGSMLAGGIFAVLQIVFAFFCHRYLNKHRSLNSIQLITIVVLLTSALVIAILPPLITIQGIYSLSGQF